MLKNIIGTISTRILVAFLTLAMVLINAHVLGAEKVGTISLIILAITILQLISNFIGGGALVYLLPRTELIKLLVPSAVWAVVTAVIGSALLDLLHLIPAGFALHVMFLSMLLSLASVNFMILMGKEQIREYNIITLLQVVLLFLVLMFFFFVLRKREVMAYVFGMYASYGFAFLVSLARIIPAIRQTPVRGSGKVIRDLFRLGSVMQLGNVFQFFNYRISYYFIEFFLSRAAVGVYSVGVQLSESIWLIAKSIHMVQYTRISNEKDEAYASRLTLSLVKVSFFLTFLCLILVMLLLFLFFSLVFRPEFSQVPSIMMILAAGILTFSVSINLSPYFSGTGKPVHNTISAGIGLVFTVVMCIFLIPRMGLAGAALAATCSYIAATVYQFMVFIKMTHVRPSDFILRREDLRMIRREIRKFTSDPRP
jgi:O-antigen/teichoic acid export membrane protein